MNDRILLILTGIAAVAVTALASGIAVHNLTDRALSEAMKLGKVQRDINDRQQELMEAEVLLGKQKDSLENLKEQVEDLMKQATGITTEKGAQESLRLLRELSEEIRSSPELNTLLDLKNRMDALTDPDRMECSTVNEYG